MDRAYGKTLHSGSEAACPRAGLDAVKKALANSIRSQHGDRARMLASLPGQRHERALRRADP